MFLGDYVDRGPASRDVIDILIAGPPAGLEAVWLKGNHEDFMLRFIDEGVYGESWLMNGGGATMASYGVERATDTFHAIRLPETSGPRCPRGIWNFCARSA